LAAIIPKFVYFFILFYNRCRVLQKAVFNMIKELSITIFFLLALFAISSMSFSRTIRIDTNELFLNPSVTNIATVRIREPELPNTYLRVGDLSKIEFEEPQTTFRRFDIIFFISIPITFYLTLNILQIVNYNIMDTYVLTQPDWNYIYFNTLLIPMYVAYQDYLYMENRRRLDNQYSSNKDEWYFGFTIFRTEF